MGVYDNKPLLLCSSACLSKLGMPSDLGQGQSISSGLTQAVCVGLPEAESVMVSCIWGPDGAVEGLWSWVCHPASGQLGLEHTAAGQFQERNRSVQGRLN